MRAYRHSLGPLGEERGKGGASSVCYLARWEQVLSLTMGPTWTPEAEIRVEEKALRRGLPPLLAAGPFVGFTAQTPGEPGQGLHFYSLLPGGLGPNSCGRQQPNEA
jgi:hypothetical protein